ncbi:MAG: hypothetical protein JSU96_11120, partial [Acidobacteriota bacterium]
MKWDQGWCIDRFEAAFYAHGGGLKMMKLIKLTLVFLVVAGVTLPVAQAQEDWEPYAQREVLKQVYSREGEVLSLESCGEFRCNGSWKRAFPVS